MANMEQEIVKNIRNLSRYIKDVYLQSENEKHAMLQTNYKVFYQQINTLYKKWFPKAKPCTETDIITNLFTEKYNPKDNKIIVKYSLSCLMSTSQRVYNNIQSIPKEDPRFLCELNLLKEISFEAAIFLEFGYMVMENKKINFGHWKRSYIDPHETYIASSQILRTHTARQTNGDFVFSPTAIFLIRQSLELWIQSIFGINYATDEKNKLIKLQPERLFALLDTKRELVQIPIPKSVILKIHKWTQAFVHAGWLPPIWEIEHVQHVIQPLFYNENVKIKKEYFDSIEDKLKEIYKVPKLKLHKSSRHCSELI